MNLISRKQIFPLLKGLFLIILGYAIAFLFNEPLRRYLYESPPALEYRVLSTQLLGKSELLQLLYSNFKTSKVDFLMDDNILSGYYYTVIELRNEGNFIKDDLLFDLDFMNDEVKILGVLCKMIDPEERELKAEIERPPLELQLPKKDLESPEVQMFWNSPQNGIEGAIVYRSYSKHAGFGRRNPIVIVDRSFSEKPPTRVSYYYGVTNQDLCGRETELDQIVFAPVPEIKFNKPHFKDTVHVRLHNIYGEIDPIALLSDFNKAKAKLKNNLKIFVDLDRKEFGRMISEKIDNLPVYFRDDVKFLRGKTTLRISNIMRKAKIHFYIVSKTYLKYDNNNLTLSLRDIKDMKLKKIHVIPKQTQKQDDQPTAKELLTPYQAKVFRAKDKVILAWVKPKSQTYEGVRIFRSSYSQPHTCLVWGKELYDGTGIQGILICEVSAISLGVGSSTDTLAPPPPKIPRHRDPSAPLLPKAPTGLRLEGVFQHVLNGYKGQLMPFYEDREVTSGNSYVYTLVAYGNNGQYSYPVEAVIRYEPTRNEPTVDSFSEYQNNLKVLQALKQFYIDNKNTINADQIQSAISEIEKKQTPTTKP